MYGSVITYLEENVPSLSPVHKLICLTHSQDELGYPLELFKFSEIDVLSPSNMTEVSVMEPLDSKLLIQLISNTTMRVSTITSQTSNLAGRYHERAQGFFNVL